MIALFKALVPGTLLTWIVCLFIGSGGSSGGFLRVHEVAVASYEVYWSWPLFLAGTGLFWVILLLMR